MEARCATHPDVVASGTCSRCGRFTCGEDTRLFEGITYCAECVVRPDVDWLSAFRERVSGKRGLVEWGYLLLAVGLLTAACFIVNRGLVQNRPVFAPAGFAFIALVVFSAVTGVAWFACIRFARTSTVVLSASWSGLMIWRAWPRDFQLEIVGLMIVIVAAMTYLALSSLPSRMFFGLPVSDAELRKFYETNEDNPIARHSALLGFVGLLVPTFGPAAIVCALIGLSRVDPLARPPVGNRSQALLGLTFGAVGILSSAFIFRWAVLRLLTVYRV